MHGHSEIMPWCIVRYYYRLSGIYPLFSAFCDLNHYWN